MNQKIRYENRVDKNGNPAGGRVEGMGILIEWQNGPLGRGKSRKEPNGAFVEGVIEAVLNRLDFYQTARGGKFYCLENDLAMHKLAEALTWLDHRTRMREKRGVEGTHAV
jgi:hypothetical protein